MTESEWNDKNELPKDTPEGKDIEEQNKINDEAPTDTSEKTDEPTQEATYWSWTEHAAEQAKKPKKVKKEVHFTHGAVALLVVFCLIVSILAGAGVSFYLGGMERVPHETTSGIPSNIDSTNASTGTESTAPQSTTSTEVGETAPAIVAVGTAVEPSALSAIANHCIQSVVVIDVTETVVSYGQEYTQSGAGSGVIYTTDGYIITNYHVVGANTKSISVTLYDGTVYTGTFIYGDEYSDVSVIKIDKNDCVASKIGDSTKMSLGDTVLAIGNPLGYGLSVTHGIVSALACDVTVENLTMTLMRTDAAINSGNSGGGLFNTNGELIGIVNAKIGGTSVEAMGYAIPSSTVIKCVNDLKDYGYVTEKARLGVTVQTKSYQSWPYMQTYSFIQVVSVSESGSAAKSGLKAGDILQKINGSEITSYAILQQLLTKYEIGDTITLTVRRPTVEYTGSNLSDYLNSCEEVNLNITFVEFNPNV